MSIAIPDLWPEAVVLTDAVTPLTILKHQAGLLRGRTNNILQAEVISHCEGEEVTHEFQLVVPALARKTYKLFEVCHSRELVYPACVIFHPDEASAGALPNWNSSQTAFTNELVFVFRHPKVVSIIQSLLAQANEKATSSN